MATISEVQAAIAEANELVVESSRLASGAALKAEAAKQIMTAIANTSVSGLLAEYQVALTNMIAGAGEVVSNSAVAVDAGERYSAILSA